MWWEGRHRGRDGSRGPTAQLDTKLAEQSQPITANHSQSRPRPLLAVIRPVISHRPPPAGRGPSSHSSYLVGWLGGF